MYQRHSCSQVLPSKSVTKLYQWSMGQWTKEISSCMSASEHLLWFNLLPLSQCYLKPRP